ncbi:iron ABC transporter permease [Afipia massiliensis]|uniref:Iron ABC transporter permease n=1 Tax=Afipia massiliensis TaxID=211460 RepID=A0A4V6BEK1_9BRAD|nr:lipocalin-like domain-containing protein [Afipia massiliensis]TKT69963.1 iron ABC transporter permease [Afipia massiliensis]
MSVKTHIDRRAFVGGSLLAMLSDGFARAQGFAGLGGESEGFAAVVPGRALEFPRDHGPHPDYRIEWWYLTANLNDASGAQWGAQWTLFRQAMAPGAQQDGWANQQIWMGHAAITSATTHRYAEKFARGGVGQAGAEAVPFHAWIDSWEMRGLDAFSAQNVAPIAVSASGADFSYALNLTADRPLVLQGDGGYSRKSERGQASYYFSQPYFSASGTIVLGDKQVAVTGRAWMDREWSSQPLASDQTGWDWVSLHLDSGEKVMLFRLRQKDGGHYFAGNWIDGSGHSVPLATTAITMTPTGSTDIDGRKLPTSWSVAISERGLKIDSVPLNAKSWMGTRFAYWEGPISFKGSHTGIGYLEMTGY